MHGKLGLTTSMTPERILQKLARRSSLGTEYIAANYTIADLKDDLIKLAMDESYQEARKAINGSYAAPNT